MKPITAHQSAFDSIEFLSDSHNKIALQWVEQSDAFQEMKLG